MIDSPEERTYAQRRGMHLARITALKGGLAREARYASRLSPDRVTELERVKGVILELKASLKLANEILAEWDLENPEPPKEPEPLPEPPSLAEAVPSNSAIWKVACETCGASIGKPCVSGRIYDHQSHWITGQREPIIKELPVLRTHKARIQKYIEEYMEGMTS